MAKTTKEPTNPFDNVTKAMEEYAKSTEIPESEAIIMFIKKLDDTTMMSSGNLSPLERFNLGATMMAEGHKHQTEAMRAVMAESAQPEQVQRG